MGTTKRVDDCDPVVAKGDKEIHTPMQGTVILVQAAYIYIHVTDWVTALQEDPILKTAVKWISSQKVQDLLEGDANTEESKIILQEQKKLKIYQGTLYHCHTPVGKLDKVCNS